MGSSTTPIVLCENTCHFAAHKGGKPRPSTAGAGLNDSMGSSTGSSHSKVRSPLLLRANAFGTGTAKNVGILHDSMEQDMGFLFAAARWIAIVVFLVGLLVGCASFKETRKVWMWCRCLYRVCGVLLGQLCSSPRTAPVSIAQHERRQQRPHRIPGVDSDEDDVAEEEEDGYRYNDGYGFGYGDGVGTGTGTGTGSYRDGVTQNDFRV
jgi:hypothetical protein